ncbi:flagellar hook-length control protein [Mycobacterium yunnanensis]|uniref:Flagellar hook-length control protein n=2 Tax=Mycobacterium yunnanensis TaxID=368477 RepID=A0A9X2Z840_9MYCO|nr:flagellar hook-length control protein [Mycobacterium yunnanensis]
MAAMDVAEDLAAGKLQPAALDAEVAAECRTLFGTVTGVGDPLWELHVEVARQVLALGGVPAGELAEWTAVQRQAEGADDAPAESWMVRALEQMADEDGAL